MAMRSSAIINVNSQRRDTEVMKSLVSTAEENRAQGRLMTVVFKFLLNVSTNRPDDVVVYLVMLSY